MMTTTGLRNVLGSRRFVGALCGLTLAVSAIPALGFTFDLPLGGFTLCLACGNPGQGGFTCQIAFCGPTDACNGEFVDTDGDGQNDGIRARCVQVPDGL